MIRKNWKTLHFYELNLAEMCLAHLDHGFPEVQSVRIVLARVRSTIKQAKADEDELNRAFPKLDNRLLDADEVKVFGRYMARAAKYFQEQGVQENVPVVFAHR